MTIEQEIYSLLADIIPTNALEILLFCELEKTAYEMKFYVRFPDKSLKDCYTLAEQDMLNEEELNKIFYQIYRKLILTKEYVPMKRNVFTFRTDRTKFFLEVIHYEKNIGLYQIKQEWKNKYL